MTSCVLWNKSVLVTAGGYVITFEKNHWYLLASILSSSNVTSPSNTHLWLI